MALRRLIGLHCWYT